MLQAQFVVAKVAKTFGYSGPPKLLASFATIQSAPPQRDVQATRAIISALVAHDEAGGYRLAREGNRFASVVTTMRGTLEFESIQRRKDWLFELPNYRKEIPRDVGKFD